MGITGQGKCLYASTEVDSNLIYNVSHQKYNKRKENNLNMIRNRPRVAMDANMVAYPYIFKSVGPYRALLSIATGFSESIIDVIIIFDNGKRHHSKNNNNRKEREKGAGKDRTSREENRINKFAKILGKQKQ